MFIGIPRPLHIHFGIRCQYIHRVGKGDRPCTPKTEQLKNVCTSCDAAGHTLCFYRVVATRKQQYVSFKQYKAIWSMSLNRPFDMNADLPRWMCSQTDAIQQEPNAWWEHAISNGVGNPVLCVFYWIVLEPSKHNTTQLMSLAHIYSPHIQIHSHARTFTHTYMYLCALACIRSTKWFALPSRSSLVFDNCVQPFSITFYFLRKMKMVCDVFNILHELWAHNTHTSTIRIHLANGDRKIKTYYTRPFCMHLRF